MPFGDRKKDILRRSLAGNQGQTGGGMPSYTGALDELETNIISIEFDISRWD